MKVDGLRLDDLQAGKAVNRRARQAARSNEVTTDPALHARFYLLAVDG